MATHSFIISKNIPNKNRKKVNENEENDEDRA